MPYHPVQLGGHWNFKKQSNDCQVGGLLKLCTMRGEGYGVAMLDHGSWARRAWKDSSDGAVVVALASWFQSDIVRGKKELHRAGCLALSWNSRFPRVRGSDGLM